MAIPPNAAGLTGPFPLGVRMNCGGSSITVVFGFGFGFANRISSDCFTVAFAFFAFSILISFLSAVCVAFSAETDFPAVFAFCFSFLIKSDNFLCVF